MSTTTRIAPQSPLCQAVETLRQMEAAIRAGEVDPKWQVDRLARVIIPALTSLDARLDALEERLLFHEAVNPAVMASMVDGFKREVAK